MDGGQYSSWRVNSNERRQAISAALHVASSFIGPLGPLVVWGLEYIYDRRDLIFNQLGTPAQAYTADQSPLRLSSLRTPAVAGTLSISTPLTSAARQLGLRNGDPVSVVLSGHQYVQNRSGLVVPTRFGERVDVSVPSGSYSLAAFGSRREALFTAADPYSAAAGGNVMVSGRSQFDLALTPRTTVPASASRLVLPQASPGRPWQFGPCIWCGTTSIQNRLQHAAICPKRPSYRCVQCGASYRTAAALGDHRVSMHGSLWERFCRFIDEL